MTTPLSVSIDPERRLHLDDVINHCLHCGMCLPVCPTYAVTSDERSSPRGRIRLIRSVADGSLDLSRAFADEMLFCLDCQACQSACPAGVRYGELVEDARTWVAEAGLEPWTLRWTKFLFLRGVLSSRSRTILLGRLLWWYDRSGLREALERSGVLSLLPASVAGRLALLPHASGARAFDETVPERIPAIGERRGTVAFLSGCIMNIAFAGVHRDAVAVLTRNGYDVIVPARQECCGALHGHNGDPSEAVRLARAAVDLFSRFDFDALVVDSGGCAAHLKAFGQLLPDDPRGAALAGKTKEITEFLAEVGFAAPAHPLGATVTYHEACHLVHSQQVSRAPRALLAAIPGAPFAELPEATWCCGSAGIYNVTRYGDAMRMLDRKIGNLASTGAAVVATANPGCHLQLEHGIREAGLAVRVVHPVTLLREAGDPR